MTDDLDHAWRSRRHETDRTRIRRITAGLEEEAETLANGTLVPRRRRLAPAEHWRPAPPEDEQAEEPWPEDEEADEPVDQLAEEPAPAADGPAIAPAPPSEPAPDEDAQAAEPAPQATEQADEPAPEPLGREFAWPPASPVPRVGERAAEPAPEPLEAEPAWPPAGPAPEVSEQTGEPAPEAVEQADEPAPRAGRAVQAWQAAWQRLASAVRSAAEREPSPDEEAEEPEPEEEAASARRSRRRVPGNRARTATWLDRLLVVIEVLAMLGLVVATFASLGLVDRLTNDLSRLGGPPATRAPVTAAPTPTPLPSPSATAAPSGTAQPFGAVLPGGREATPAPTQAAPAASLAGARITIEAISVDAPIVEGDDWETLKQGVGHHPGTPLPGEAGNVVLAAHNDVYGSIFRKLSELREGDAIRIDTQVGSYRYRVTSVRIVLPTETSVLDPAAGPALTLITCYPPLVDTHRVVVTAESVE